MPEHTVSQTTRTLDSGDAIATCRTPFRVDPIVVPRVWGGSRLLTEIHPRLRLEDSEAGTPIGETWAVSDVGDDPSLHSVILDGPGRGATLREVLRKAPREFLGRDFREHVEPELPLLYKFIDARSDLSVQVHPSDELLREMGQPGFGKSEAWVILDAVEGAAIIYGLEEGVSYQEFLEQARQRYSIDGLKRIPVKRGDVVHLPAGTVHAIGAGILLAEIQQSSDTTYRIYDWGRLGLDGEPRQLHLEEAARVTPPDQPPACPLPEPSESGPFRTRIQGPHFRLEELRVSETERLPLPDQEQRFAILSVLDGHCVVIADGVETQASVGDTFVFPAGSLASEVRIEDHLWALWMQPAD